MRKTILTAIAVALVAGEAMAEGRLSVPVNDRWQAECGSCHLAYPPQLLPAQSWQRLMAQLDRHFGVDASVDAATTTEIRIFLEKHAGRGTAQTVRVTETAWFRHEHDELPSSIWKHPAVKSAANCAACHTTAEQGDFRERNIRLPR